MTKTSVQTRAKDTVSVEEFRQLELSTLFDEQIDPFSDWPYDDGEPGDEPRLLDYNTACLQEAARLGSSAKRRASGRAT